MTGGMTALPINLKSNPRLSRWLRFDREGFVELSPGKVELGQGSRSEERRVGKECKSQCRSRWSPYH